MCMCTCLDAGHVGNVDAAGVVGEAAEQADLRAEGAVSAQVTRQVLDERAVHHAGPRHAALPELQSSEKEMRFEY